MRPEKQLYIRFVKREPDGIRKAFGQEKFTYNRTLKTELLRMGMSYHYQSTFYDLGTGSLSAQVTRGYSCSFPGWYAKTTLPQFPFSIAEQGSECILYWR